MDESIQPSARPGQIEGLWNRGIDLVHADLTGSQATECNRGEYDRDERQWLMFGFTVLHVCR